MPTDDDIDERIDALYAGPPDGFTAARTELVRELRAAGEREEAERVQGLRRPTRIAAELNRLAREEPEAMAAAIAAEEALEAAQAAVLDGSGSAAELGVAAAAEGEAVATLTPDPEVRAAMRLAARSSDARDDLRRGRLSRDPAPDPGAGLFGGGQVVSLRRAPASGRVSAPAPEAPAGDELAAARERWELARRSSAAATAEAARETTRSRAADREEAKAAAREERAATRAVAEATRRAERAEADRNRAAAAVTDLRSELEAAEGRLAEREAAAAAAADAVAEAEADLRGATERREAAEARLRGS